MTWKQLPSLALRNDFFETNEGESPEVTATAGGCISFLGLNIHFDIFAHRNGPSVTVKRIFEYVHYPIGLSGISNECNLNGISCAPCEYGVSTYSL